MRLRLLVILLVLGIAGLLALVALQWRFGLGGFAQSPQEVALLLGQREIVGGGRAVVGFTAYDPPTATLGIQCEEREGELELTLGQSLGPICGVTFQVTALLPEGGPDEPPELWLTVAW